MPLRSTLMQQTPVVFKAKDHSNQHTIDEPLCIKGGLTFCMVQRKILRDLVCSLVVFHFMA